MLDCRFETTPEERFKAWLAEQEASGALDRPRRPRRCSRAVIPSLVAVIGAVWALGRLAGRWRRQRYEDHLRMHPPNGPVRG